ncbi:transmembrane protein [Ceratobasidium sp. AG-Ba]|nr:transmembrane protein [Ceratobasidium sp. AG-Ba]
MAFRLGTVTILATTATLLANIYPVAARRCGYDRYGRYRCTSGLARAARIGLGVGMAVLGILLLLCLLCLIKMRRRRARKHMDTLPAPATAGGVGPAQYEKPADPRGGQYNAYPGGGADFTNHHGAPQFPEATHQPAGGYAPPPGAPPNAAYAPPAGPPPGR